MDPAWIEYLNQNATRNQPLSPDLVKALSFLEDMDVKAEVFSGGQHSAGEGPRVGSVRHDHGGAGDMFFSKGGKRLDWANEADRPIFEQIVANAKQRGVTGIGAGPGYMRQGSMHLGFGKPAVWGAGGDGANAPDWLVKAYGATPNPASKLHPEISPMMMPEGGSPIGTTLGSDFLGGFGKGAATSAATATTPLVAPGMNPFLSMIGGFGKALGAGRGKGGGGGTIAPSGGLQDDPGRYAAAAALMQQLLASKQMGMTLGA